MKVERQSWHQLTKFMIVRGYRYLHAQAYALAPVSHEIFSISLKRNSSSPFHINRWGVFYWEFELKWYLTMKIFNVYYLLPQILIMTLKYWPLERVMNKNSIGSKKSVIIWIEHTWNAFPIEDNISFLHKCFTCHWSKWKFMKVGQTKGPIFLTL